MKIDILSIFPQYFPTPLEQSLMGRVLQEGKVEVRIIDVREFSADKHKKVDDRPFGGGPGMVLVLQPVVDAIEKSIADAGAEGRNPRLIITTCRGEVLKQAKVDEWLESREDGFVILCGHYEDFDARLYELFEFDEICLGDFILSGGEPAALCIVDALIRKLPGTVGNPESIRLESFESGRLDYPVYTRPVEFRGLTVPEILLSGDHGKIEEWRKNQAEELTRQKRPDILGS